MVFVFGIGLWILPLLLYGDFTLIAFDSEHLGLQVYWEVMLRSTAWVNIWQYYWIAVKLLLLVIPPSILNSQLMLALAMNTGQQSLPLILNS